MIDQDKSAVYDVVAFVFDGKHTATENLDVMEDFGTSDGCEIKIQAVVDQDETGKVHIHEPGHGVWRTTLGAEGGGKRV